jgi:anti-anti-sigma regulatory factor/CheY-like chemotaxis protein
MEILQGIEYTIIKMPENISETMVDALIEEFSKRGLIDKTNLEFLIDMQEIRQLHKAALTFIIRLCDVVEKNGCKLYIAGLQDAVENALKFNHIDQKTALFKTIIDFEAQRELEFDVGDATTPDLGKSHAFFRINKPNAMIVEPNLAFRQNQKSAVMKLSVGNIIEVKDPPEALKRLRDLPFSIHLILIDFDSIQFQIAQFIHTLLSNPACLNAMLICTVGDLVTPSLMQEALGAGAKASIEKNFNFEALKKLIATIVI